MLPRSRRPPTRLAYLLCLCVVLFRYISTLTEAPATGAKSSSDWACLLAMTEKAKTSEAEKAKTIEDVAKEWDDMADQWTSGEMGQCVLEFNHLAEEVLRQKVPDLKGFMAAWQCQGDCAKLRSCCLFQFVFAILEQGKDLLEFGAGHGVLGLALAPDCGSVTLVDVAPKMVAQAQEKIAAKRMEKTVSALCCLVVFS
eukprot:Skav222837  [mRNA]  locus=scaffold1338:149944:152938:- [translate_table: standard]